MKQKLESCLVVIMRPIGICNGSLTFSFEKAAVGQNDLSLIAGVTRTIRFISNKENIKTFLGYAVWNSNPFGGGGHFNFVCTGVCGHRIGKLTHPQTKAGPQ